MMIGPGGFGQAPNVGVGRGLSASEVADSAVLLDEGLSPEHVKLQRAWAAGTATKKQILRCMELDRSAEHRVSAQTDVTAKNSASAAPKPRAPRKSSRTKACGQEPRLMTGLVMLVGGHMGPRTKLTHPYNYDPILVFDSGKPATASAYSDRLSGWYEDSVLRAAMQKHFGEQGDYYTRRSAPAIQAFLRELMAEPELELTRIEEQCNQASGYPVWFFGFITNKAL